MKSMIFKMVFLVLVIPSISLAEGEPWRTVNLIAFAEDTVGLSITEGDYIQDQRGPYFYELDLKTLSMKPLDEILFKTKFNPKYAIVDQKNLEGAPSEIRTSNGDILKVKYTGCIEQGEGGPACSGQIISFGKKQFSLDRGNVSILSAEKFSDQLWLALGYLGEYGWHGKGVYVYDLELKKKLFFYKENVMGGLLVSTILSNNANDDVWLGTSEGLRIIDPTFKKIKSYYFYDDFDSKTGVQQHMISSKPRDDNWLAKIARRLEVSDGRSFQTVVKSLSTSGFDTLKIYEHFNGSFYPPELNLLLPFFLSATNSKTNSIRERAEAEICKFRDVRALEYFINKRQNSLKGDKFQNQELDKCIAKLIQADLAPKDPSSLRQIDLRKDVEESLLKISNDWQRSDLGSYKKAISSANSLAELGNQDGVKLIIEHIQNKKKSFHFSSALLVSALSTTKNNIDFGSTLSNKLEASTVPFDPNVAPLCNYFDMNFQFSGPRLLSEKYARSLLKFLTKLQEIAVKHPNWKGSVSMCVAALKSQLASEEVLKKFKDLVYTGLDPDEKELYDQISSGKFPKSSDQ